MLMDLGGEFGEYMELRFPRPRNFPHHDMADVSPEAIERRKKTFWGHVEGIHPALLAHWAAWKKSAASGETKQL
jgi:hypothetical protein